MKKAKTSSLVFLFLLWLFVLTALSTISIEARKNHGKKSKMHKSKRHNQNSPPNRANSPASAPAPLPQFGTYPTQSRVFNILSFGAKANGVSDDSKVNKITATYTHVYFLYKYSLFFYANLSLYLILVICFMYYQPNRHF